MKTHRRIFSRRLCEKLHFSFGPFESTLLDYTILEEFLEDLRMTTLDEVSVLFQHQFHFAVRNGTYPDEVEDTLNGQKCRVLRRAFRSWVTKDSTGLHDESYQSQMLSVRLPSGILVLLNRRRYSMMSSVCKPTETAA